MNNLGVLTKYVVVFLLVVIFGLGHQAYAQTYTATSVPSLLLDGSNVQIRDPFNYSLPDTYHSLTEQHGLIFWHSDYVQPGVQFPSFYKDQTQTYNLKTGVYDLDVYQEADYTPPNDSGTQSVNFHPVSRVFRVINDLTESEHGHVQLVSNPSTIECDTDFDLAWPRVRTDSSLGNVEYKVQERLAVIEQSFTDSWVDAAGSLVQTPDGEAYEYNLNAAKPAGTKYQYRLLMRGTLDGYVGRWTAPIMSDVIVKPMCTPATDQSKYSLSSLSIDSDQFDVVSPNSSGISFTKIPALNVTNKPLHILNFADESTGKQAAKIIVIEADSFVLSNHINILGEQAELILLNTNALTDSEFSCTGCSFENSSRITLAMAKAKLGLFETSSEINQLLTNKGTTLKINGILASGAASLDLLAEDIDIEGVVTTNYRASFDNAGEYQIDPQGSKIIGAGSVNIFAGNLGVNYEQQVVKASKPRNPSSHTEVKIVDIKGNIESAAISISSHEPLVINAQISTYSDALASDVFKNKLFIPNGVIKIQTYGRSSLLDVKSSLVTDKKIMLSSREKLHLNNIVRAQQVDIVSDNKTFLKGGTLLESPTLRIGAGSFENNGNVKGQIVNIETEQNLLNRFGGVIRGVNTTLISTEGTVRNGSLTPYRVTNAQESDYTGAHTESYQHGTYFLLSKHQGNADRVSKLTAHIYGDNVSVKARNFENINPYYRINNDNDDWSEKVDFQNRFVNQVSLQAVKNGKFLITENFLNSSALIYVLGQGSQFSLDAGSAKNERYRSEMLLQASHTSTTSASGLEHFTQAPKENTEVTNSLVTAPFVYSPPGYIYVAGNSLIRTSSGLVNNISFIELIGELKIQGPVESKGVRTTTSTYYHAQESCDNHELINPGGGTPFDPCAPERLDSTSSYGVVDVGTRATLFRVFGNLLRYDTTETNPGILGADFKVKNTDGFADLIGDMKHIPVHQRNNEQLREASLSDLDDLKQFVSDIKESLLEAWDTVSDWFKSL